ncbi:MAG: exopolyphosphatase [Methyloversatilis sp.]|jgi:exopolyphosphatase/guanosine-5'-triphosphate,3'-diphosphate pyrophosphatase|nr:exopolyphosphatase [Methyloversatilis sp.]
MTYELLAAVDLGSNSFRLQVARVVDDQIYPLDGLKETVRLAAGLGHGKLLDGPSQLRAIEALSRFNERLRGFAPDQVRAVATNTLRVAKNAPQLLQQAEAALGFPIEVIAGREEARLIYVGVAHTLPNPSSQQLVVDIGGGSTEFIVGRSFEPLALESLYMGCVAFSLKYFPDGRIDKRSLREAELAARRELETIEHGFRDLGWDEAVGSSGTARALLDIMELYGWSHGALTRDGMEKLRAMLLRSGDVNRLGIPGFRAERLPVLPGGFAIMAAIFDAFDLDRMSFSEGALRLGVLYDLLGRYHHQDLRDATVLQFMRRYQVDKRQSDRVHATALRLLSDLYPSYPDDHPDFQLLSWAARLHEIGISVAHAGYHKHSAYIVGNADMPGFSRMDQSRLARVVLAHRGKLEKVNSASADTRDWPLILCLRLAALMHRSREDFADLPLRLERTALGYLLVVRAEWLTGSPLTAASLHDEVRLWSAIGIELKLRTQRAAAGAAG